MVIDPRIESEVGENPVTQLLVEGLSMDTVLNLLQGAAGEEVVWTTRGNVVWFTNKSLVQKTLSMQIHSVADLTTGLTNFIPPTIQLVSPDMVSDEENPLFGAQGEEPILPYGTVDELIELIKNAVEPTFWAETEGADIRGSGEHAVLVKATDEMQNKVEGFLNDLRALRRLVVTIETRFLDGRGTSCATWAWTSAASAARPGPLVPRDVTNGLEDQARAGSTTAARASPPARRDPSSGMFSTTAATATSAADARTSSTAASARALDLGGGDLQCSYLDDTDLSMVLRAVEKSADGRLLNGPVLTVLQHPARQHDGDQPALLHPGLRRRGRPDPVHRRPDRGIIQDGVVSTSARRSATTAST